MRTATSNTVMSAQHPVGVLSPLSLCQTRKVLASPFVDDTPGSVSNRTSLINECMGK